MIAAPTKSDVLFDVLAITAYLLLRSTTVNFAILMRAVKRGLPLLLGAVNNQRSLLALDNLVDFIFTCITHPLAANQTFSVSDEQDISTTELVRGIAFATGAGVGTASGGNATGQGRCCAALVR